MQFHVLYEIARYLSICTHIISTDEKQADLELGWFGFYSFQYSDSFGDVNLTSDKVVEVQFLTYSVENLLRYGRTHQAMCSTIA